MANSWGYGVIQSGVGIFERPQAILKLTGSDLVAFLQGALTNDMKTLTPGQGLAACHLDAKGRLLASLKLFQKDTSIWAFSSPAEARLFQEGIKNTLFLSESTLEDVSAVFLCLLLIGEKAAELAAQLFHFPSPAKPLTHRTTESGGFSGDLLQDLGWEYPAYLWLIPRSEKEKALSKLKGSGLAFPVEELDAPTFEILRVESGLAAFGIDTNEKTLPPEVNLDDGFISYTKGCYVGQEVIARIKHLGHVNKRLSRIKLESAEGLGLGLPVFSGEKEVGTLTSSVYSPRFHSALGLATLRLEAAEAGQKVKVRAGDREISGVVM